MVDNNHYAKDDVSNKVAHLKEEWAKMMSLYAKKKVDYDQCMQVQLFNRDVEQMEAVMVKQEVCCYINECAIFTNIICASYFCP